MQQRNGKGRMEEEDWDWERIGTESFEIVGLSRIKKIKYEM